MTLRLHLAAAAACALVALPAAAFAASSDTAFIQKAVKGDTSEIELGRLAQRKGASPAVRDFGRMLVSDHTQSRAKAEDVARTLHVDAPETPTADAAKEARKLSGMSGPAFDQEMARFAVHDHKEDIADYQREADQGHGPAAEHARKTLPTLRQHLAAAQRISG